MKTTNRRRRATRLFTVCFLFAALLASAAGQLNTDETQAVAFLNALDDHYLRAANAMMKARWNYITNVNEENSNAQVLFVLVVAPILDIDGPDGSLPPAVVCPSCRSNRQQRQCLSL